jgi:putative transposase
VEEKRGCVEPGHADISLARQCELIGLNRSSYYYQGVEVDDLTLGLMRLLDEQYTRTPFYGVLRMTAYLRRLGHGVNPKRVRRLLRLMGLGAVYPKPNTSQAHPGHKIYPYLLRGVDIDRPHQVWSSDITYIRLRRGFVYLMAVIDWFSRYVLDWSISTTLEADFCVETLERVLSRGRCEIFNTDQGAQFTSPRFTDPLIANGVQVSMDGRGRALDNIFVERLWRSVKYEKVYLTELNTVAEAKTALAEYFTFYNTERLHQALAYRTPHEAHYAITA